ncbi:hypothetical protein ACDF64_01975 [Agromyces sp. MMS24-JH15]|uniref:hypothetical protein n=1 Tax=Agromyces sp. MMS24-JH15 TaxID=3243765 RepID=UPI0037487453
MIESAVVASGRMPDVSSLRTHLRVVSDAAEPLQRRITNLSNAVERFRPFGFTRTFELLYSATGASPGKWTPEQLDVAARLIDDAHASWAARVREEQQRAREAKRQPGYRPLSRDQLVDAWWDEYASFPGNRALWNLTDE